MISGAAERFVTELDQLIDDWADKPDDDCLTTLEMVGAFEIVKSRLLREAAERRPRVRLIGDVT